MRFDRGTLLFEAPGADAQMVSLPGVRWDARVGAYRAPAWRYRDILTGAQSAGVRISDAVSGFRPPPGRYSSPPLRPYQQAALEAWLAAGRRGVLALPTGSGKTRVALAALARVRLPALCLVPTRVLLHQWVRALQRVYSGEVGRLGDGSRTLLPVTVATFESAYRQMPDIGDRFGLLVVDEVHHFGESARDDALRMCVAGARMGLTATPRDDGGVPSLEQLVGPVLFEQGVRDLAGRYLADFDRVVVPVSLTDDERREYSALRGRFLSVYRPFAWQHRGASWLDFQRHALRSDEGKAALAAWWRARRLLAYPRGKADALDRLLHHHRDRRLLVFTADNEAAYAIARRHLIMPVTSDIGRAEREAVLARFARGDLRALVSARVLNEGLDLPDAEVAIVVGGSRSQREHVQRVGRVLRPRPGKRARVYELVVSDTVEVAASEQRSVGLV